MVEILAIEPDPFSRIREARERHVRRWQDIPLRALGGNVLIREVKLDTSFLLIEESSAKKPVVRIGEVLSLGSRWNQQAEWQPPMPTPKRTQMLDGSWEAEFKEPELYINRYRPGPPTFTDEHKRRNGDIAPGDLVVYINSRVYDVFQWEADDILVYPGCWIQAVITETHLADNPELRRFAHADA